MNPEPDERVAIPVIYIPQVDDVRKENLTNGEEYCYVGGEYTFN